MKNRNLLIGLAALALASIATVKAVQVLGYQDLQIISAPGNPPSGFLRFSAQTGALGCLTSAGGNCLSGVGSPLTTKGDLYTFGSTNARLPVGTNTYVLTANSGATNGIDWEPASAVTSNQNLRAVGATFTGNGSALSGTATDCQEIGSAGTINAVYTIADISGSVTVGISTVAYASYTGTAGAPYTSIVASAPPSLSSAVKYTDSTLTGWTTSLTAGQIMCVQISSPATVTNVKVKVIYAAN